MKKEAIKHPDYYGGKDNPYEAIKVIEAWGLNFSLGNVLKYINRAGKKSDEPIEDLKKAVKYLEYEIKRLTRIEEEAVECLEYEIKRLTRIEEESKYDFK